MKTTTYITYLTCLLILSGCDRKDTATEFDTVNTSTPNRFLQYPNMQPSLAAGTYTVVAATTNANATDSYTITITKDDETSKILNGRWTLSGGKDPASLSNPQHLVTLDTPGGIKVSLESGTDNYLYLLDRSGNVLYEDDNSGTSNNALLDLPTSLINNQKWTEAYYAAIDPGNERDTLNKWKTKNGFDAGHDVHVIFRDTKDLGYGRNMYMRKNANGCLAIYVENFLVEVIDGLPYNTLNLIAAIKNDRKHHFGSNAIEFSDLDGDCDGSEPMFNKFFTFVADPSNPTADEPRLLSVDLDGRGEKYMPIPCITCHGGTAKPLEADGSFPSSAVPGQTNPELRIGDTNSKLQPFEVDTFEFSDEPGYTREDLEDKLKELNEAAFSTYPGTRANGEWDADFIREVLDGWYGGHFLSAANNNGFDTTFVPQGWKHDPTDNTIPASRPASSEELFLQVVKPYCFACHSKRGTNLRSNNLINTVDTSKDVNFSTYEKFVSHAEQIEEYVYARGQMPMSRLTFDKFWESNAPEILATHIPGFSFANTDGTINMPGKPIADAGLNRTVVSPVNISAHGSFFADNYSWKIIQQPGGSTATIADESALRTELTADTDGLYKIELTISNNGGETSTDTLEITIDSTLTPNQNDVTFDGEIFTLLQSGTAITCISCHTALGPIGAGGVPIYYDADSAGYSIYENVRQRVNFSDLKYSPILRKPTGNHHFGNTPLTDADDINMLINWISEGAREK